MTNNKKSQANKKKIEKNEEKIWLQLQSIPKKLITNRHIQANVRNTEKRKDK